MCGQTKIENGMNCMDDELLALVLDQFFGIRCCVTSFFFFFFRFSEAIPSQFEGVGDGGRGCG